MTKFNPLMAMAGIVILSFGMTAVAQDKPPTVAVTALSGPLHLIQGRGGNVVASVGIDGIMLVDDDYGQYAEAYQQALSKLSNFELAPSFVLNTHWHSDHTGSNEHWGMLGATLFAHSNVRLRMSTRQENKISGRAVEPSPRAALPVVTYNDAIALHFNGSDIEVQHYPGGHTDGDSVVFFSEENVVHLGDLFFKDSFPYVDISSGGNVLRYTANVAALLDRIGDATVIVPGHGALADKADLLRFHQMLTTTTATVKTALEQGMTLEAVTQQGLGAKWATWGDGFIKEAGWIEAIANSLNAPQ